MQFRLVDVNSEQYKQDMQRLQSLRTQVVLWLVVLALGTILIPLMLITNWVRNDVTRLEGELFAKQTALINATSPSPEVVQINNDIASIETLISTMQTVTIPSGVNWPVIMDAVERYDATAIQLTSLVQAEPKLQIAGLATSNDAVVRYQQNLLDSRAFNDVVVASMSTVPLAPLTEVAAEAQADDATNRPFGNVEFVIDLVLPSSVSGTPATEGTAP